MAPGHGATTKPGRNRWTYDQRLTVHLLHSRFDLTVGARTRIFNTIFAEPLRKRGLPNGIDKTRVQVQYAERLKLTVHPHWRVICAAPATPAESAKRDLIAEQIARTARTLDTAVKRASTKTQLAQRPESGNGLRSSRSLDSATVAEEDHLEEPHLSGLDDEYAAPPTPTPVRKKRTASQLSKWAYCASQDKDITAESDSDVEYSKHTKRIRTDPKVVIPIRFKVSRTPSATPHALPTPLMTPRSRRGPGDRKPDAIIPYAYPSGNVIYLTDKEFKETQEDLVAVGEAAAHPPIAGLLFRYWTDDCQSKLDGNGEFVAGRFATTVVPPPPVPTMQNFPWSDAAVHLNRDKIATPFVSASNHLTWIIRLAVKEKNRGVKNGRITLLDPHAMDRRTIFHAQPFHRSLCKKRPFENAAFMYHGKHEFMIYHKVPRDGVMHSFTVEELLRFVRANPAVDSALRLNQLAADRTSYAKKILASFQAETLVLDKEAIRAIASVVRFLGLDASFAIEPVMHIVSDILQGWAFTVKHDTPAGWSQAAGTFAAAMDSPSGSIDIRAFENMKLAFLDGVRWSRGDFNTRHNPETMRIMLVRAKKIGLEAPTKILTDELDAVKLNLMLYDKNQQRLLHGTASQALLTEADNEDDSIPITPRSRDSCLDDEVVFDTDED